MRPLFVALVACTSSPPPQDITGPVDGPAVRYVVDGITIPTTTNQARDLGDDLDGDGVPENQLGNVIAALAGQTDVTHHVDDILAGGRIAMAVQVRRQDDLGAVELIA